MNEKSKLIVIVFATIVAGAASGVLSGYFTSISQNASFQEQIEILKIQTNELKTQNDILEKRLQNEEQQTETMKKSLEKESLISLKVNVNAPGASPYGALNRYQENTEGITIREIIPVEGSFVLIENENILFELVITNVGSDTAIINYHGSVDVIIDVGTFHSVKSISNIHPNGTVISHQINKILAPNSNPLIIPFWLQIDSDFAPKGQIKFTVIHDLDIADSASIKYTYREAK